MKLHKPDCQCEHCEWQRVHDRWTTEHAAERAIPHHEKPCADRSFISYRAKGRYGWIMIGAKDDADAMREAGRSTDTVITLERWDGTRYVGVNHDPLLA